MEESNRHTLKARWSTPRGWAGEKTCEAFLDSEPMTMSSLLRTRTVSRSIKSFWDMALPSHFLLGVVAVVVDCWLPMLLVV